MSFAWTRQRGHARSGNTDISNNTSIANPADASGALVFGGNGNRNASKRQDAERGFGRQGTVGGSNRRSWSDAFSADDFGAGGSDDLRRSHNDNDDDRDMTSRDGGAGLGRPAGPPRTKKRRVTNGGQSANQTPQAAPAKKSKKRLEDEMQTDMVKYVDEKLGERQVPYCYCLAGLTKPNALWKPNGYMDGSIDLWVFWPRGPYGGLGFEFKIKPNKPSTEQSEIIARLNQGKRYYVVVCCHLQYGKNVFDWYARLPETRIPRTLFAELDHPFTPARQREYFLRAREAYNAKRREAEARRREGIATPVERVRPGKRPENLLQSGFTHYVRGVYGERGVVHTCSLAGLVPPSVYGRGIPMGYMVDFPDWWLLEARGPFHGLFFEFKCYPNGPKEDDTEQTDGQLRMLALLRSFGYYAFMAWDFASARAGFDWFMSLPPRFNGRISESPRHLPGVMSITNAVRDSTIRLLEPAPLPQPAIYIEDLDEEDNAEDDTEESGVEESGVEESGVEESGVEESGVEESGVEERESDTEQQPIGTAEQEENTEIITINDDSESDQSLGDDEGDETEEKSDSDDDERSNSDELVLSVDESESRPDWDDLEDSSSGFDLSDDESLAEE